MSGYSRPAVEFQATLQVGDKFTPTLSHTPNYGQVLTVDGLVRRYKNPDDCMYWIKNEEGVLLEPVTCGWLRKHCTRVDEQAQ